MNELNNRVDGNEKAVRTTIVGGRPPGRGRGHREIPHGVEALIKKASVDASFRQVLLDKRAEAAHEIGLKLTPTEIAMLDSAPAAQIEAIIENTKVPDAQRRAFLGQVAAVMLAAIATSCECRACRRINGDDPEDDSDQTPVIEGIRPDTPTPDRTTRGIRPDLPTPTPAPTDIRPDLPDPTPVSKGIRPDLPTPTPMGIRPDLPVPTPTPASEDAPPDQS